MKTYWQVIVGIIVVVLLAVLVICLCQLYGKKLGKIEAGINRIEQAVTQPPAQPEPVKVEELATPPSEPAVTTPTESEHPSGRHIRHHTDDKTNEPTATPVPAPEPALTAANIKAAMIEAVAPLSERIGKVEQGLGAVAESDAKTKVSLKNHSDWDAGEHGAMKTAYDGQNAANVTKFKAIDDANAVSAEQMVAIQAAISAQVGKKK